MKLKFQYWRLSDDNNEQTSNVFVLFLALMLLLLAFFILLNSISQISKDKYTEAIKSIESTFKLKEGIILDSFVTSSISGADPGPDKNLEDIGSLFKAEMPLVKSNYINDGQTIRLSVPTKSLFTNTNELNPKYYALMDRLIDALNDKPYLLYVFISRSRGNYSYAFNDPQFAQADQLSKYLSRFIKNAKQVDIGIDYRYPKQITFYISREEAR